MHSRVTSHPFANSLQNPSFNKHPARKHSLSRDLPCLCTRAAIFITPFVSVSIRCSYSPPLPAVLGCQISSACPVDVDCGRGSAELKYHSRDAQEQNESVSLSTGCFYIPKSSIYHIAWVWVFFSL